MKKTWIASTILAVGTFLAYGVKTNLDDLTIIGVTLGGITISLILYKLVKQLSFEKKIEFIKSYKIPKLIKNKFLEENKEIDEIKFLEVEKAFKQYFAINLLSIYNKGNIGSCLMASKIVDDLWHEFILDTKSYSYFCKNALGEYLHHNPSGSESSNKEVIALKNTYKACLLLEQYGLNFKENNMPLIFAIDELLDVKNGNKYVAEELKYLTKPNVKVSTYQSNNYGTQTTGGSYNTNDDSFLTTAFLINAMETDNSSHSYSSSCSSSSSSNCSSSSSSSCSSSSSSSCSSSSSSSCSSSSSSSCSSSSSSSCSSGGSD